jgi:hypothetical protein
MKSDLKQLEDIYSRIIIEKSGRKVIKGTVTLSDFVMPEMPEWLSEVELQGDLYIKHSYFTSLKGMPKKVNGMIMATRNPRLRSLEGCPDAVQLLYLAGNPRISSFVGGPTTVKTNLTCQDCGLVSLEGIPKKVGNHVTIFYNRREFSAEEIAQVCKARTIMADDAGDLAIDDDDNDYLDEDEVHPY